MEIAVVLVLLLIACSGIVFWLRGLIKNSWNDNTSLSGIIREFWNLDFYPGRMEEDRRSEYCSLCGFVAVNSYLLGRLLSTIVVPAPDVVVSTFVSYIPIGLFLIQYMFFSRLSLKRISIIVITLIPFALNYLINGECLYIAVLTILCCAGTKNLKQVLRNYAFGIIIVISVSWLLSSIGVLPSTVYFSEGRNVTTVYRHSLGLVHPNTTGIFVGIVAEIYLVLRWKNIRWFDWILPVLVLVFIDRFIDSRGSFISLAVTVMILVVFKYYPRIIKNRVISVLLVLVPVLVLAFTLYSSYCFDSGVMWMRKFDSMLTGRLAQNLRSTRLFPVRLLGTNTNVPIETWNFTHNAALKYLLGGGIIIFAFFAVWNTVLMFRLVKLKALPEIALAVGSYAYWFVEEIAAWPQFAIYMFLMGSVILWKPVKEQQLFVTD